MEPIPITTSRNDSKKQLNFLINIELTRLKKKYNESFWLLTGFTFIWICLFLFTNSNSFVTLKAVTISLLSLAWLVVFIFLATFLIKRQKRLAWRKKTLDDVVQAGSKYYLLYDEEKMTIITNTYKTELKWDHFKYYTENNLGLFILTKKNIYEAFSISSSEIGQENLLQLKKIVHQKLIPIYKF